MSIQKFCSKSQVTSESIPYTQVNTKVIQSIKFIQAGFVWVYLLSKPKDWLVIKSHLRNNFGISEKMMKKIFSYLTKSNLIRNIAVRTPDNKKISHFDIEVLNGESFINIDENLLGSISTRVGINTCSKAGTTNKRYIKIKDNIEIKEKDKRGDEKQSNPQIKRAHPIPDDFVPDSSHEKIAQERSINIHNELEKMIDWCKGDGVKKIDWNATFRNWLRRAKPNNITPIPRERTKTGRDLINENLQKELKKCNGI